MSKTRISELVLFALLSIIVWTGGEANHLPPCGKTGDTYGSWFNSTEVLNSESMLEDFKKHFYGPSNITVPLEFTDVWVPHRCSYHRFTNETFQQCAKHSMKRRGTEFFNLLFIGDSGTRGMVCGLSRLLGGTELLGPLNNRICGGHLWGRPISNPERNQCFDVFYGWVQLTFCYLHNLVGPQSHQKVRQMISYRPHALVHNSGAWDFDHYAQQHQDNKLAFDPFSRECSTGEVGEIVRRRTDPEAVGVVRSFAREARRNNVRPIYRNNHFNQRFSAYCADEELERLLAADPDGWEIWDNRNISRDVFHHQNFDGFHYDRHKVHAVKHHEQILHWWVQTGHSCGEQEMQFAQSLLQSVCGEFLEDMQQSSPEWMNGIAQAN